MNQNCSKRCAWFRGLGMIGAVGIAVVLVAGCASEKPKPMAQPSSEQVKGSADRAFDRLKQEEGERRPSGM
ncbi:MAG TPA: hypothetical protein PKJ04_07385 [Nitrospira sp.]|jgi:outer membrane murein-binding lipoprotein Lpp|nr:hypothetical protein [Nitrospira sp.]MBX3336485.1 hypothetical protein [Nitrospira sp.]HNA27433.1 hypothetical protein [Nitrospira sp.]HNL88952.1 hypothetical protein [Nitrospira sp.]HNN42739.1 hypothetical protein [Nitrospira sp.]